jgi:hypothetical protein
VLVHLPETEVHVRGEDRKHHDLESVHGRKFGYCSRNTQQDVKAHTYTTGCGRRNGVWNINSSIVKCL